MSFNEKPQNIPQAGIPAFRYFCQKVLPAVYDDSLSYYEVLCKVVDYINKLIENDISMGDEINKLKAEMAVVQKWISDFDAKGLEAIREIIGEYLKIAVFFGITDSGYFVAYIPETWDDIDFGTTEYDYHTELETEFGHLVLSY